MNKKLWVSALLVSTLSLSTASHAFFAGTDVLKLSKTITERIQQLGDSAAMQAIKQAGLDMYSNTKELEIDTWNNGVANYIARINQAKADIQKLGQIERMMPATEVCSTALVSVSLEDSLCTEDGFIQRIRALRNSFNKADTVANISPYAVSETRLANAAGEPVMSGRATYDEAMLKSMKALQAHIDAGREAVVFQPDLYQIHESSPFTLNAHEIDIATHRMIIEYPPHLAQDNLTTDREKVLEARRKIVTEGAAEVVAKHIALKVPAGPNLPSKLEAMHLAANMRLMPDGSLDGSDESFMQKIALSNAGEGVMAREKMIMKSIQLSQALERYKQSLAMEHRLHMITVNMLEGAPLR